jgi:protocatechuate 3,4-dioxygenase beta subunit
MKTLQKIALVFVAALVFHAWAATTESVTLSGTVVDRQGKPIPDAAVECYDFPARVIGAIPEVESTHKTTTDEKGAFQFSVPNGAVMVVAKKAGFGSGWKTWQSIPTGSADPLVLTAPSSIAGVVVTEKGAPMPGVEVNVSTAIANREGEMMGQPDFIFGKAASELFSTRTSADGHFRIENFPTGAQANLSVKAPGRALRPLAMNGNGMQFQAQAGQEDVRLVTDPAASIEGKVVVKDTGVPLTNARIQLQPVNSRGGLSGISGPIQSSADGTFRIPELAAGSYNVFGIFTNAPVPLWVTEKVPVTVTAGETARDVKIQAFKGAVLEVTVVGKADQKGVPDANVSAYSEDYQVTGTTAKDGTVWFRLPAGQFSMIAGKQGLSQAQSQARVADGETNRVKLELNTPSKISGVIRDSSGSAVAGVAVSVVPFFGGDNRDGGKTDADGHYELTWQKPSWAGMQGQRFYLLARDAGRKLAGAQEIDETTASLDLELKPAISISGRIQNGKGKPIANATAFVSIQTGNSSFTISMQPARAGADGRIQLDALPAGRHYNLYLAAGGYGSAQQEVDASDAKVDHFEFPPVTLKLANLKLAGRVLGTDGKPAAGVQVWMHGEGQPNGNTTTDTDGRFSFDAVCDGPISVNSNSKGFAGSYDGVGGDTNVVIRFNQNNRNFAQMGDLKISGTVYDPSGNPVEGARVGVTPSWGPVDGAVTGKDGEYSLHWQAQQGMRGVKYFVVAQDTRRNLAGMEEIDAKKTQASVRLAPGFSVSGTVLDTQGNPLTRANVNLNMMVGNMGGMIGREPVSVGSDGTFTISALPKGQQYSVFISAADHGSAQKSITRTQSQGDSVQLAPFKLRTADQELAGQLLGVDGKPLSGAQVYTYGNNQPNVNARTDSSGHFKFKVCSGPINVNAFLPQGGGGNNYASIQARGGDMNVVMKIGDRPQPRMMVRSLSLKPQPWTFAAISAWPARHKTSVFILLGLQAALLFGTGGGLFWMTMKRKLEQIN